MVFGVVERKLTLITQRVINKSFIKKVFRSLLHNARDEIDCEQSLIFFFAKLVTRNPSTRAGSRVPQCGSEDVLATSSVLWNLSPIMICWESQSLTVTSWFAIALTEIRTGRILREKVDCEQSSDETKNSFVGDYLSLELLDIFPCTFP